jgi:hypothetical protein
MEAAGLTELEAMSVLANQLPERFGDGWLSKNAQDMVRVALIAGFDAKELIRRIALRPRPGRVGATTNAATVEHVMAEMDEARA